MGERYSAPMASTSPSRRRRCRDGHAREDRAGLARPSDHLRRSSTAGSTSWHARSARVASGRDAPVATVLGNRPEWVEVALASARLGARLVPASWRSTTDELDYLLRDSGAVLLVSEPGARAEDLGPTLHVGDEYERALAEQSDAPIPGATTPGLRRDARVHIRHDRPTQGDRPPRQRRALDARRASEHVPARLLGPHRCRRGEPHVPPAPPRGGERLRAASARVRADRRHHGAIRRRSTPSPHRGRGRDVHEHGAHAVRPHRRARAGGTRPLRRVVDEARAPRVGARARYRRSRRCSTCSARSSGRRTAAWRGWRRSGRPKTGSPTRARSGARPPRSASRSSSSTTTATKCRRASRGSCTCDRRVGSASSTKARPNRPRRRGVTTSSRSATSAISTTRGCSS